MHWEYTIWGYWNILEQKNVYEFFCLTFLIKIFQYHRGQHVSMPPGKNLSQGGTFFNTPILYTTSIIKNFYRSKLATVCVCVCVCVCLYSFTVMASSVCNDVWDILEEYESTILRCEYHSSCSCQVPSSPFLKISIFTSKDETPAPQ